MSNNYTYAYGETNPAFQPIYLSDTTGIQIGDCLWQDTSNSNQLRTAAKYTFGTVIATPSAPTLADGAVNIGTVLTNSATHVKVSYQFPWGEGALSAATAVTPTAHAAVLLSGVAVVADVIGLNVYVETSAGSGTYKLWGQINVQGGGLGFGDILITGYGLGQAPPGTTAAQTALAITQYGFAQAFCGVAAQFWDGTTAGSPAAPTAFGLKDGMLRYDTSGVYRFNVGTATAFNAGALVGLDNNSGALYTQQVIGVSSGALSIGRVAVSTNGVSVSTVLVDVYARGSKIPQY